MRAWAACLLCASCAASGPDATASIWATPALLKLAQDPKATAGGFRVSRLMVKQGQPIPWREPELGGDGAVAAADAVVVQPGFADGEPAAYVVTEIWENHPDPWVQAVYQLVDVWKPESPRERLRPDTPTVFTVGTDSTFYSPFWRAVYTVVGSEAGPWKDVASVTEYEQHGGALVLCPVAPDGVRLSGAERPLSNQALAPRGQGSAYVNGDLVKYLVLGADNQVVDEYQGAPDGTVPPADLYVFALELPNGSRSLLDIPAVLPEDSAHHAYVRRVDVLLNGESVFVPAGRDAARAALIAQGANVPAASPGIPDDVAGQYFGRVALGDGACFMGATFPAGCTWLDSEEALEDALSLSRFIETDVTLTATRVPLK